MRYTITLPNHTVTADAVPGSVGEGDDEKAVRAAAYRAAVQALTEIGEDDSAPGVPDLEAVRTWAWAEVQRRRRDAHLAADDDPTGHLDKLMQAHEYQDTVKAKGALDPGDFPAILGAEATARGLPPNIMAATIIGAARIARSARDDADAAALLATQEITGANNIDQIIETLATYP